MNGWSCSPKHSPAHFTALKHLFVRMVWSFLKTFYIMAGPCSPKHGSLPFTMLKNLFVWMTCSHSKTFSLWLGRAPQHLLSRPSFFCALKNLFDLTLCRLSTTFNRTACHAPPNTIQLFSRCWRSTLFGWCETFQKHSKVSLGRAPPNTAQFFSRCWKTFLSECYAAG